MANTTITTHLESKRLSPEVQAFKNDIISFLNTTNACDEIKYRLCCDLAKKIDMPFYKEKKLGVRSNSLKDSDVAKEYIRLLIDYNNHEFARELFSWLTKQQNQTLRKLHKRSKHQKERKALIKTGIYEHPVPMAYSRNILLGFIKEGNYDEACAYIDFLNTKVPQIFLSKEEDNLVNRLYKDTMPEEWNWKNDNPFIRYVLAGIPEDVYIETN